MPNYKSMNDILKKIPEQYRRGKVNRQETPEAFRERMVEDLQDDYLEEEILDELLPDQLKKYRISEPQEKETRSSRSASMLQKKVGAFTAQVGRQEPKMPYDLNQAGSAVRYYLIVTGQTALAEEYEKVMALSGETLEETMHRIQIQDRRGRLSPEEAEELALEEQDRRRHARGSMLVRLLEPLGRIFPENIADLSDEEAEQQYVMYHAMFELLRVLQKPLSEEDEDSEIQFTQEEREICENALDFLEPLARIECQTDLICNPYYPYLDTKAISGSPDIVAGRQKIRSALLKGGSSLELLGDSLERALIETRREAAGKLKEELKARGFNPDSAVYTRIVEGEDGEPEKEEQFDPNSPDGMSYIYGGGRVLVTMNDEQLEMRVQMDHSNTGTDRNNIVSCEHTYKTAVMKIRKKVKTLKLKGELHYNRPGGAELDLENPEDITYINDGGRVIVTADNGQVQLSVKRAENFRVSHKYTMEHALIKTREWLKVLQIAPELADYTWEDGSRLEWTDPLDLEEFCEGRPVIVTCEDKQVRLVYDSRKKGVYSENTERHEENLAIREAALVNEKRWEAHALCQELRDTLKTALDQVKDADPAFLKSSDEYKRMRRSLGELKKLLENEPGDPGSRRLAESLIKLKKLTKQVSVDADAYLAYKGMGTTDYARRRVNAASAVKRFANQQIKNLNKLAYLNQDLLDAEGKASLETLVNRRNQSDEMQFRNAGTTFAIGKREYSGNSRISRTIYRKFSQELNPELYHRLDLDLPGSRKTFLSESARKSAVDLMVPMVVETLLREDQKKYNTDETPRSRVSQLIVNDDIPVDDILKLVVETPTFRQTLEKLTRDGLFRLVTEPDHRTLKELAEAVGKEVSQEKADRLEKEANMNESGGRRSATKSKKSSITK